MNYFSKALKLAVLLCVMIIGAQNSFAQQPAKTPPPPLPSREVSGIVKDSTDLGVIGATVSLTSDKDTLKTSTNNDGIFVFKNVKSATYTIVVQSIGYTTTAPMRFKQNDLLPRIVMDPIMMKEEKNTLNTVVINGTPSITYKTDTVEYKASDYVVRKNASVDELLKKMEGMEVGTDGSLVHNGESVLRAKVNGKEFLGGDVANAIKNLPAEIVDKIQIVDDYGDQAARTGVKDGDPQKILNITTRTDKSVGNIVRLNGSAGNNDRYEAGINGTRINQNQTIGVDAKYRNTVNGVGGGGTGGTTTTGEASFSIRDKIGKKVNYNVNYKYDSRDELNLTSSFSKSVTNLRNILKLSYDSLVNTFTTRGSRRNNDSRGHNFRAEIEIDLDSNDYMSFKPSINFSSSSNNSVDTSYQTGYRHQYQIGANSSSNKSPQLGMVIGYQHRFDKPRRNFFAEGEVRTNNRDNDSDQDIAIRYFLNEDESAFRDSLVYRLRLNKNLSTTYRGSMTYVEPLGTNTQVELNAQINYNGYDNNATTRNRVNGGVSRVIDSLSNIFNYSFTQARFALNFRYGMSSTSRIRFSAGITAVPALLSGTKVSLGTTTRRTSFNMIPIARMEYLWSRQHKISLNYSGNASEPTFDQIQPVRDVTNPNNPVIGNPDLKARFVHTIRSEYNNYIANAKLNYSVNVNASFNQNDVISSSIDIIDPNVPVLPGQTPVRIRETRFINMDGVYRIGGNYNISKQLSNRKYNLAFSGSANYNHRITMNNGEQNINVVKNFRESFGPRMNPTDWFEINPYISYNQETSENSVLKNQSETNTLAFNVDGRVFFLKSWIFSYEARKNYVSGINANITNNPFVINATLEKELFDRRGKVTLQAFDVLNQNNFVNRDVNDSGGYTDTKSNAISRFFMVGLTVRLQKWSGAQGRGGRDIRRRGDGSFM
ncbi:outer membrane beta-barrel protein [Pedobacter sp. GR22-6]|uniref:outer membrane beta-barrel protein n=1 Tax=Pedobacter sp. GR22-6 TaxID=3127957 RepID=UPI00307F10F9